MKTGVTTMIRSDMALWNVLAGAAEAMDEG
jgi:hypothetical protein